MNIEDFKEQVAEADWSSTLDELCVRWLEQSTKEYGKNGRIADQLLNVVRELMEI